MTPPFVCVSFSLLPACDSVPLENRSSLRRLRRSHFGVTFLVLFFMYYEVPSGSFQEGFGILHSNLYFVAVHVSQSPSPSCVSSSRRASPSSFLPIRVLVFDWTIFIEV